VPDEKPPLERALDLLVYAPVGVALYARDMFPTVMGIFVSRGKREVKSHLGLQEPAPPVPPPIPDLRRAMGQGVGMARGVAEGGLGLARDFTGSALQGLLSFRNGMPVPPAEDGAADADPGPAPPVREEAPSPATEPPAPTEAASAPAVESLPIPDYDELSASQVIERLEGLDAESLAAIRAYEASHRGRNTILGKIAQLT